MKLCPHCQTENFEANVKCKSCGQGLDGSKTTEIRFNKTASNQLSTGELLQPVPQFQPVYAPFHQPISVPQFRCPFCQSTAGFRSVEKISTGGMIFAVVLFLFLCWPLFWIGLLMKDKYRLCRSCGMKLG